MGLSLIIQQFYFGEDLYYLATHFNAERAPAGSKARPGGLYIPYDDEAGLVHRLIKVEPIIRLAPGASNPSFADITSDRIYTHIVFQHEEFSKDPDLTCLTNGPETPNYFEIAHTRQGMDLRFSPQFAEDVRSSMRYP